MNKVKIICDSTIDLPKDLCEKRDISIIPLHVDFKDEDFLDGETITIDSLFEKVDKCGEIPHTAAPSVAVFEDAFKKYVDQGMDVVYLGLGSFLSSTYQNAYIASQSFPENRIFLVDSKNLSTASGILALHAAQYRDEGFDAKEIAEKLERVVPKLVAQFNVDNFKYLYKGGRCSGAARVVGTLLHIHPHLKVVDEKLIVYKKPRGPMKIAIKEQLQEIKNDLPINDAYVILTHANADQELVDWTYEELKKLVNPDKIIHAKAGAVIGTHCGPKSLGIVYCKKLD